MQTPSIATVVEGQTLNLKQTIIDDFEEPIIPHETTTGVEVFLYDNDTERSIIDNGIATPDLDPGSWQINLTIPYLDLKESAKFQTVWTIVDEDGATHTVKDFIVIEPAADNRESDTVYVKRNADGSYLDINLPFSFFPATGDKLYVSCYLNNVAEFEEVEVRDYAGAPFKFTSTNSSCNLQIKDLFQPKKLEPYTFMARLERAGGSMPKMTSQSVWVVTPQVIMAANQLEAYINKARVQNVIPSLEYTIGDLVTYLYRGLNMLNQLPPHITGFTGMNMQGHLLENWVQCAGYYALGAQLQAEGALAFDFSGQTVSLNVDRTPSIEGALGRIESYIESHIRPYKKMLIKAGVTGGDGSQGSGALSYGKAFGKVFVTNSPTTRLNGVRGGASLNGWTFSPRR
tara:strand:+ start:2581 stop:3783 length:1203 start_codon:yes stop_codon:yes gene_type:complete